MKHTVMIAALAALASPAVAGGIAEPVVEAPVEVAAAPAPGMDWTGFYAGLSVLRGTASDDGGVTETDTEGFGAQIGYLRDLGTFVVGGELAHVSGDFDAFLSDDWTSTRLKLIGGYDAGRLLPYAFVGLSQYEVDSVTDYSDTVTIYGLGAKIALTDKFHAGLEYVVENKDNYDDSGIDAENADLSLRLDYRF